MIGIAGVPASFNVEVRIVFLVGKPGRRRTRVASVEGLFIGPETKGHERGLLGAGLFLLQPVDLAGFRERVQ